MSSLTTAIIFHTVFAAALGYIMVRVAFDSIPLGAASAAIWATSVWAVCFW